MSGNEIRERYLAFMAERGHATIPSAAIVPENDPTTLFTGSGMQPLVPYLLGEAHPKGTRLANSQKCFRAEDIDEVGDNRHTTFFEMLGNWSLGDYFKTDQLTWFFSFLVDELGLDPNRLYVTVFAGDDAAGIPQDTESVAIWQHLFAERGINATVAHMGSEAAGGRRGMRANERIFYYDASKNWWSRAGTPERMPVGEIGGPDSEVFYDFGSVHDTAYGEHCHPNCDCGRFLEIGNSVFIEYQKTDSGFTPLPKQNVDFGGGLERLAAATANDPDVFMVDLLRGTIDAIAAAAASPYETHPVAYRVVADHIRGAVFMIGDGITPSNTEQGYFVRRLLRRAVRFADMLELPSGFLAELGDVVIRAYEKSYTNLHEQADHIRDTIAAEEAQFRTTLEKGMREFQKLQQGFVTHAFRIDGDAVSSATLSDSAGASISGEQAFTLFTTYGFPIELTEELAAERGISVDRATFDELMTAHRERSRAGAAQKFSGGLADHSTQAVAYHTLTHLLLAALRQHLGPHVHQAGSNITGERLRFDFTHPEKVPPDTLETVANTVNSILAHGGTVTVDTMPKAEAEADPSVEGSFWDRYPDEVKVYTITGADGAVHSRELCGGPHVTDLADITGTFAITKEEGVAGGVRRIKAVLREPDAGSVS